MTSGRPALPATVRRAGPDLCLCIHGLGCSRRSYDGVLEAAALARFSVLVPDLPGHGDAAHMGPGHSIRDLAAACRAAIREVEHERLHIVAHSMGGAVGLLLAEDRSLPLASFVNVEGNLVADDCGMLSRRVAEMDAESFAGAFAGIVHGASQSPDPAARLFASWAAACPARAFHESSVSLVEHSDSGRLLELFNGLAVPRAYVFGGRSPRSPALLRLHPAIEQVEVPDVGHFVMGEAPRLFYGEILPRFLCAGWQSAGARGT